MSTTAPVTTGLDGLFNPRSVAVVGASSDPSSMGGRTVQALIDHDFEGGIYPVNPRRDMVAGLPCYPDLQQIPDEVDVALVLVSPERTPTVLEAAADQGARWAVLLNAGFAEVGGAGVALQEQLVEIAQRKRMRLVGPNCGGLINVRDGVPLGFLPAFALPHFEPGPLGVVAQSGGVLTNVLNKAYDRRLGLSFGASTGNEPDLTVVDFLQHLIGDEGTRAIAIYAESIREPDLFVEACRRAVDVGKPIVMLKAGRSVVGQETATSHTGALATSHRVLQGVADRYGVHLVDDLDDLLDISWYLANENLELPAPRKVVTVATSGGTAVMTADALDAAGMTLPQPSPETLARIESSLPAFGISRNPIDITAQYLNEPDLFGGIMRTLEEASEYDAIVVSLAMITTGYADKFAAEIDALRTASSIPLVVAWTGGSLASAGITALRERGVPVFTRLGVCAEALGARARFEEARGRASSVQASPGRSAGPIEIALPLSEHGTMRLLAAEGLPFVATVLAHDADEAADIAEQLGFPVVLKLSSDQVAHKSDVGGVVTGLRSRDEVVRGYAAVVAAAAATGLVDSREVVLQPMVVDAVEVLVGARRDPTFGWVVVVGSGGVLTELLEDAVVSVAPLDAAEVDRMLRATAVDTLTGGFRGSAAVDHDALRRLVLTFSQLLDRLPAHVNALELNPVMVTPDGAFGADALITRAPADAADRS